MSSFLTVHSPFFKIRLLMEDFGYLFQFCCAGSFFSLSLLSTIWAYRDAQRHGVVAWAARRLGWPITWMKAAFALVAGSTLSIFIAILLETFLPFLAYFILYPL